MCWSGEASAVIAATFIGLTMHACRKGEPAPLCAALAYFLWDGGAPGCHIHVHRSVWNCCQPGPHTTRIHSHRAPAVLRQPVALYFIPADKARRLRPWVYAACSVGATLTLTQLIPSDEACRPGRFLAAPTCVRSMASFTLHGSFL